ncbi:MAG: GNAT family N-acetyltransferase, partial [Oscillospiraceae bacterium]|nr:GNAT family N-acetyltransferase [Oscillospiraceae bacterium]
MTIRRAETKDMEGVNKLLKQVLMIHHNGRPDIFKPDVKKYTDNELKEIFSDDEKPVFVAVDTDENV